MLEPEKDEDRIKCFREIIEFSDSAIDENEYLDNSEEEAKALSTIASRFYGLLSEMVKVLAKENKTEDEFYTRLYNAVFCTDYFPKDEEDRGIVMFLLCRRIGLLPYYQAHSKITISENEFRDTIEKIEDKISAALFMIRNRFSTTREEAIELHDISKSLESDKEKAVYWTVVLSQLKRNESNES